MLGFNSPRFFYIGQHFLYFNTQPLLSTTQADHRLGPVINVFVLVTSPDLETTTYKYAWLRKLLQRSAENISGSREIWASEAAEHKC